ncbi:hypothetical protein B7494_g2733 [Chlorociboria aeruginascens]|nr:hypothetical protein B7494_g2733 [Chlorociboria aeruginascens]
MPGNRNLHDFFKPVPQPKLSKVAPPLAPSRFDNSLSSPPTPAIDHDSIPTTPQGNAHASVSSAGDQHNPLEPLSSSLSPPPSIDIWTRDLPLSPPKRAMEKASPVPSSERVIRSSDDEDEEDSDSSLEDLAVMLQGKSSSSRPRPGTTPTASRYKTSTYESHASPIAVLPKYKFDMKALVSQAAKDNDMEAKTKRIKAMLSKSYETGGSSILSREGGNDVAFSDLLESVVAEREDGGLQKVKNALERTEAATADKRWYFFDPQSKTPKADRNPFPKASIRKIWKDDLMDPQLRHQAFLSGFVENAVSFGRLLPDELFLWTIDEICLEDNEFLRSSYANSIGASEEQCQRLIVPSVVDSMFLKIKATKEAINVSQNVRPMMGTSNPYINHSWAKLHSVIRVLCETANNLQQETRTHIICLLLRLCMDYTLLENADLLSSVQWTISRLCRYIPDTIWEACRYVPQHSTVSTKQQYGYKSSIASPPPRPEVMISAADSPSNIYAFIERLSEPIYAATPQTDYRELSAQILLLNIAVDDAQSIEIDLTDAEEEMQFNNDIERLAASVRSIQIPNAGAAYISRVEAKEILELVAHRIADTLRTKPKPRTSIFDEPTKKIENLERERHGMKKFVSRGNGRTSRV